jgi:hypothetical protein
MGQVWRTANGELPGMMADRRSGDSGGELHRIQRYAHGAFSSTLNPNAEGEGERSGTRAELSPRLAQHHRQPREFTKAQEGTTRHDQ